VGVQPVEEPERFRHHADPSLHVDCLGVHRLAEQANVATRRVEQPRQAPDRGALAGAVRAQKAEERSARHDKRQIVHRNDCAVLLVEMRDVDRGCVMFSGVSKSHPLAVTRRACQRARRPVDAPALTRTAAPPPRAKHMSIEPRQAYRESEQEYPAPTIRDSGR
jgi:hypothetical protein